MAANRYNRSNTVGVYVTNIVPHRRQESDKNRRILGMSTSYINYGTGYAHRVDTQPLVTIEEWRI